MVRTLRSEITALARMLGDDEYPLFGLLPGARRELLSLVDLALTAPDAAPAGAVRAMVIPTLPLPDRGLCGNGKLGKIARSEMTAIHREAARQCGWVAMVDWFDGDQTRARARGGPLWVFRRVAVTLTVRYHEIWSTRPLDDDNFWRGCKAYLDGLADAGIVANDRQFYMAGRVEWERAKYISETGVTMALTPDPKEGATHAAQEGADPDQRDHAAAARKHHPAGAQPGDRRDEPPHGNHRPAGA